VIHCCLTANHAGTFSRFFDTWGASLRPRVRILTYEQLALFRRFPGGAYIFADLERLLPFELSFARWAYRRLKARPADYLLLNGPGRCLSRFDLLRALAARGVNDFTVYRPWEVGPHVRFPVFVRREDDHAGPRSPLLHSPRELRRFLGGLPRRERLMRGRYMVVEYRETVGADGLYRKYSAIKIHQALVPHHIQFSRNWATKVTDLVEDDTVREEREYVRTFPHRDQVAEIFRLAGITYGRIDYSLRDGRMQVWEINTNPTLNVAEAQVLPPRLPAQRATARMNLKAFRRLADAAPHTRGAYPLATPAAAVWKGVQLLSKLYGRRRI
jgi:hypothetical protein